MNYGNYYWNIPQWMSSPSSNSDDEESSEYFGIEESDFLNFIVRTVTSVDKKNIIVMGVFILTGYAINHSIKKSLPLDIATKYIVEDQISLFMY